MTILLFFLNQHIFDRRRITATGVSFCKNPPVNNVLKVYQINEWNIQFQKLRNKSQFVDFVLLQGFEILLPVQSGHKIY